MGRAVTGGSTPLIPGHEMRRERPPEADMQFWPIFGQGRRSATGRRGDGMDAPLRGRRVLVFEVLR